MIYTLTVNPSLDYVIFIKELELGAMNRSQRTETMPGGKGINVARVLHNFGMKSISMGFVGGFTGMEVAKRLKMLGIGTRLITLQHGETRINVKLCGKEETELNAAGPTIEQEEIARLFGQLEAISERDYLVLSGSLAPGLAPDFYIKILETVEKRHVKCIVDTSGECLLEALKGKPFLVKPNQKELEEFAGKKLATEEELLEAGKKMQQAGALNVLISKGKEGAILLQENGNVTVQKAPEGEAVNTVGAGDSMVAGFLYGLSKGDMQQALKYAVCAGSGSAFHTHLSTLEEMNALLKTL